MPRGAQRPWARGAHSSTRESLARRPHKEEVVPPIPKVGEDFFPQGVVRKVVRGTLFRRGVDNVD
eukprot:12012057-Alexandrium_andersonii.AAC.1